MSIQEIKHRPFLNLDILTREIAVAYNYSNLPDFFFPLYIKIQVILTGCLYWRNLASDFSVFVILSQIFCFCFCYFSYFLCLLSSDLFMFLLFFRFSVYVIFFPDFSVFFYFSFVFLFLWRSSKWKWLLYTGSTWLEIRINSTWIVIIWPLL